MQCMQNAWEVGKMGEEARQAGVGGRREVAQVVGRQGRGVSCPCQKVPLPE